MSEDNGCDFCYDEERCENCQYYMDTDQGSGECLCNPPQFFTYSVRDGTTVVESGWPRTKAKLWCGSFKCISYANHNE